MSNELYHEGTLHKSGRYGCGSGENPYQHCANFMSSYRNMKNSGMTDTEIAKAMGFNTSEFRAKRSISAAEERAHRVATAEKLKAKGVSVNQIGVQMGLNESTVRSLLDPAKKERGKITDSTMDMLKDQVEKHKYIDVGAGVEHFIGVPKNRLTTAVAALKQEGYKITYIEVEQVSNPGQYTTQKVLTKESTEYSDIITNKASVKIPNEVFSNDGGRSYDTIKPPKHVDPKRVIVNYAETGGTDRDGEIQIRRGVEDLDLGQSRYAQVRIAVGENKYLKGMAVYTDDLPDGVDIRFNTNKFKKDCPTDLDAMKKMSDDPDNPFGATIIRQSGSLNIVNEEGGWYKWGKKFSSQFLSKQDYTLAETQLKKTADAKKAEFDAICELTNPMVKKKLLDSFADGADSDAVSLKAASLPRTATHVILPFPDMKKNEIYAPQYKDGEKVVLVRHPHGGIFEIPELTVNNKFPEAKKVLGNAKDAVGIHPEAAAKLSGADFDGDTALVIPNNNGLVKHSKALKSLENFDPKLAYPAYEGMPKMTAKSKGLQMGNISNLITDMQIKGADPDEIARAVKHSMVVIDAEKHHLNYKLSAEENRITELKKKYQGGANRGAATLVSRASSEQRVGYRTEKVDPKTGEKIYEYKDDTWVDKNGKVNQKQIKSTKMYETKDAHTLSSGSRMETVYADYANEMKALANKARLESLNTKPIPYSPKAKEAYAKEVASLDAKLHIAQKNAPLERKAQVTANQMVAIKKHENPDLSNDALKKIKGQALTQARINVGAKKEQIDITDKEWEAIQAGAISTNKLVSILNNAKEDRVKELAMPLETSSISASQVSRIKALTAKGFTQAAIAEALGVSTSTVNKALE